jgi:hypothetical protein
MPRLPGYQKSIATENPVLRRRRGQEPMETPMSRMIAILALVALMSYPLMAEARGGRSNPDDCAPGSTDPDCPEAPAAPAPPAKPAAPPSTPVPPGK